MVTKRAQQRQERKDSDDRIILAHLEARGVALPVYQIADETGMPWQAVAFAIRRLVAGWQVLVSEEEHMDGNYRVRRVCYYRRNTATAANLPEWLAPRPHPAPGAQLVKGRDDSA